tara:strand:- start:193 stop:405 length:213 start_codon:yes stop_codon:yes gene_type:complete
MCYQIINLKIKLMFKKIKSKLLTRWFTEWVDGEFDLETLEIAKSIIVEKELEIKRLIDVSNRVEIKGFRN